MKKLIGPITAFIITFINIFIPATVLAVDCITPGNPPGCTDPASRTINISRPVNGTQNLGFSTIGDFVQKVLILAFIVAVIVVLFMLVWGAFEWITSGGDKENVGKARGRIINALVGLAVLAVAYALFTLAGQFLGFNTNNFVIPTPAP